MEKGSIGDRFKDAREVYNQHNKNGESIRKVAKETKLTESLLSNLENEAARDVGFSKIVKLAEYYDVSIDWLLTGKGEPKRNPCAVDDLGLSVTAVQWLKQLANSPDKDRDTKYFSMLLEMSDFQTLVFSLIEYYSALKAAAVVERLLKCMATGESDPYPTCKTYMEKLKAATQDTQYNDMERHHLEALYSMERAYFDEGLCSILDDENEGIHILDILELKINRNLNSVIRTIENEHE